MKLQQPATPDDKKPWIPGVLPPQYRYSPENPRSLSFTGFFMGMKKCPCCSWHRHILGVQEKYDPEKFGQGQATDIQLKAYYNKYRELQQVPPAFTKKGLNYKPLQHEDLKKWQDEGLEWRDPETKLTMRVKIDDVFVDEEGNWHIVDYKTTFSSEIDIDSGFKANYKDQMAVYYHVFHGNGFPVSKKTLLLFANAAPKRSFEEAELPQYEDIHPLPHKYEIIEHEVDDSWIPGMLKKAAQVFSPHQNPPRTINCGSCDTRFAVRFSEVKSFLVHQLRKLQEAGDIKQQLESMLDGFILQADNELYGKCPFHELAARLRIQTQMYLMKAMVRIILLQSASQSLRDQNASIVINRRIRMTLPEMIEDQITRAGEAYSEIKRIKHEIHEDIQTLIHSSTIIDRIRRQLTESPAYKELSELNRSFANNTVAGRVTACVYKILKNNPEISEEQLQFQAAIELNVLIEKAFILYDLQSEVNRIKAPKEVKSRAEEALPSIIDQVFEGADWEQEGKRSGNPNYKQRARNKLKEFLSEISYIG